MVVSWPVEPMVARTASAIPEVGDWSYEPKLDGFRCLALRTAGGRVRLQSRQQRALTAAFADVAELLAERLPPDTVVDGELVVMAAGEISFDGLQRRLASRRPDPAAPVTLVAFDLLALRGTDLRHLPYRERRARLAEVIGASGTGLALMPATDDTTGARTWMTQDAQGIEGVVAKRSDSAYMPRRRYWTKIKSRATTEAIIGGVTGSLSAATGLILGRYDGQGRLRIIGRTTALRAESGRELAGQLSPPVKPHPWSTVLPGGRFGLPGAQPVEHTPVAPDLVAEIEADRAYELGRYRHGLRFIRIRPDLAPGDVVQISSRLTK